MNPIKYSELSFPKHSSSIAISGKLSSLQRKVFNVLIYNARNSTPRNKDHIYSIGVNKLKAYLNIPDDDKNDVYLKNRIEEIMKIVVKFDLFHKDRSVNWVAAPLLAGAQIKNGVLRYSFSHFLEDKLLNPNIFTVLDICIVRGLKSKYSIALYENVKEFAKSEFPQISIDLLKELLGVEKDKYRSFSDLRKRVIDTAVKEINEKTDIEISYELIKNGRKYEYIKFFILPSKNLVSSEYNKMIQEKIEKLSNMFKDSQILVQLNGKEEKICFVEDIFFKPRKKKVCLTLLDGKKKKNLEFDTFEECKKFIQQRVVI